MCSLESFHCLDSCVYELGPGEEWWQEMTTVLVASSLGRHWHTASPVAVSPMSRSGSFSASSAVTASCVPLQQKHT